MSADNVPTFEVWDASVAPGGFVCVVCGTPVESEPCYEHNPIARVERLHEQTSTTFGPDYCPACSAIAQDWVVWPCPTIATQGNDTAPATDPGSTLTIDPPSREEA